MISNERRPDGSAGRALVTGSTSGIGLAIAEKLALSGYRVTLNYRRDREGAKQAVARVRVTSPQCRAIQADVTNEDDVRRLMEEASKDGPLDLLDNA